MNRSLSVLRQTMEFSGHRGDGARGERGGPRTAACRLDISRAAGMPLPATSAMQARVFSQRECRIVAADDPSRCHALAISYPGICGRSRGNIFLDGLASVIFPLLLFADEGWLSCWAFLFGFPSPRSRRSRPGRFASGGIRAPRVGPGLLDKGADTVLHRLHARPTVAQPVIATPRSVFDLLQPAKHIQSFASEWCRAHSSVNERYRTLARHRGQQSAGELTVSML